MFNYINKIKFQTCDPINVLLGFLWSLGPLSIAYGPIKILGVPLISSTLVSIVISFFALFLYFILGRKEPETSDISTLTSIQNHRGFINGISAALICLLLGDWPSFTHSFTHSTAFLPLFVVGLLITFFSRRSDTIYCILILALPITFLAYTKGIPVFTDDHASVVYRLHLLKNNFPYIPVYNSLWNAGTDWRDFFATGILNVYLLFYPVFAVFDIESAHAIIVPSILFFVLPFSSYAGCRLFGGSKGAGLLAACLSISAHSAWYMWSLGFGSLGFICSSALAPLCLGLLNQITVHKSATSSRILALATIVITLCLFWSMQGVALLPALLIAAWYGKGLLLRKVPACIIVLFLFVNLAWMSVFVKASNVFSFLQAEQISSSENTQLPNQSVVKGKRESISLGNIMEIVRESSTKTNPILLFLSLPALLLLPGLRRSRYMMSTLCFWLFFLAGIASSIKPQLELDRLFMILAIISAIPCAIFITQLQKKIVFRTTIMGFLIAGSAAQAFALQNRSWFQFTLLPKNRPALNEMINTHSGNGRALFTGFVLHEFEGSHVAPLAAFTSAPLIASSPVHNLWRYTDVIPESLRKDGEKGVETFMEAHNVSFVLAHEPVWRRYFRERTHIYTEVGSASRFVGFLRKRTSPSYFIEGEGTVQEQTESHVTLHLESKSAILKFRYYSFLTSDACEKIEPYVVHPSLPPFIKITHCKKGDVVIESVSPIERVLQ